MPEGAGDPAFADAGRAADQQIVVSVDPIAGGELLEQGAVETADGAQIDVLDHCGLAQAGELEAGHEALIVALGGLAVDHQPEALLKAECGDVRLPPLLLECLGHAVQAEGDQAFMGRVVEHRASLSVVISAAADIGVADRRGLGGALFAIGPVEAALQDRGDRTVGLTCPVLSDQL